MRRLLAIFGVLASVFMETTVTRAAITFDQAYGHEPPGGRVPSRIAWAPDGHAFTYVLASQDNRDALDVRIYDVKTHESRVLLPALKLGMKGRTPANIVWAPDSTHLAFVQNETLFTFDTATGTRTPIATKAADPHWSPDGRRIAFNKDEDVWVIPAAGGRPVRITSGGRANDMLNGDTDWVYPEELSTAQAFDWSPDGKTIAYLHFDERNVTAFPIMDFLQEDNSAATERYPLAGEKNPAVSLHVVDVASHKEHLIYDASRKDEYLPWFAWTQAGGLSYEVLDRKQQRVRVDAVAHDLTSTLYERSDPNWVDVVPPPLWLSDGSSFWIAADGTTRSLFIRSAAGAFTRLTANMRIYGFAADRTLRDSALILAAYPTRREQALLAIDVHGAKRVLTPDRAFHRPAVSPNGSHFLDFRSTINEPTDVTLYETATLAPTVIAPRSIALQHDIAPTDLLTVDSPDGPLDATMLKPPNFNPAKRYPVIVYVYGGPESPTTQNHFGSLYHQLLAQAGYIVFSIDGPESQVDNETHLHSIRYNFGPAMLAAQERGADYLATLPYVDAKRIGIWGWSFGGFATVYTLEHSKKFAAGVAVAPVTDWHDYDSIYTERYMGLPKEHPKEYDHSSDLLDAKNITVPMLVNHGTGDDNVHMANSIMLMQALISTDRPNVDFAFYPRQLHGISALADERVLYQRMLTWWQTHMPPT